jgi:hypothetical protein
MADKRISQLTDRGTVANSDVVPIVVSGAVTTNKATISSIQTFMQGNLDLGVTSVGITLGSSGTDVSVSGSPVTSSGNITINLPTASATNRGLLSAADWTTFNNKANAGNYVTLDTTQTITAQKTFTTSGSSDTMIISHGSGSGFALDVLKAGNGEAIRVTKTSGSGNAMTISGGNFEAGTIVKTGGTSSQFLKADGSVDSSTYLTTGSAASTYVPYSGAAANVNLGVYTLTASAINSSGGGSVAGQINLRSDAFFSLVNGYGSIASGTTNQFNLYQTTGAGVFRGAILSLNSITESATRTFTFPDASGTLALTSDIPSLAGYVTLATTQTITGAKTFDTTTSDFLILNSTNASGGALTFRRNGTNVGHIGNSGVLGVGILDDLEVRSGIGKGLHLKTDGGKLTLSAGGSVTLDGALNGTSASFNDNLVLTGASKQVRLENSSFVNFTNSGNTVQRGYIQHDGTNLNIASPVGNITLINALNGTSASFSGRISTNHSSSGDYAAVFYNTSATGEGVTIRGGSTSSHNALIVQPYNGATTLFNILATGAATFSSSVTSKGLLVQGNYSAVNGIPDTGVWALDASSSDGFGTLVLTSRADTARPILFSTSNGSVPTERMRITSLGYLKASNDGTYLSSTSDLHELLNNTSNGYTLIVSNKAASPASTYIQDWRFTASTPNNSSARFWNCEDATANRAYMLSNGGLANYATNNVVLSDERLKKDIEPLESYWDKFKAIEIVKYKFKDQTHDDFNIGVIAQQVEAVAPEFVDVDGWDTKPKLDEEGNEIISEEEPIKSVYASDLHHATIKVLQEAMAKIEKLETEIDSLKNQMQ